jgi:hypothetical protein
MHAPSLEAERLLALDRLDVLDTPHEKIFDLIARLIKNIFNSVNTCSISQPR